MKKISFLLLVTLTLLSCKKDNVVEEVPAYTNDLFASACDYLPCLVFGSPDDSSAPWLQFWNGYLSESESNRYGRLDSPSQYTWIGSIYNNPLKNLDRIIRMNEDPDQKDLPNVLAFGSNDNQIAAAKTLEAVYYMFLTDILGPIVLTNAFLGEPDDHTPAYDTQSSVFSKLNDILTGAYGQFDGSGKLYYSDLIYGGDISKWKRLNASIRMLLAIKLSDVDPANGKVRFARAYHDGGMTAADDGLDYAYGFSRRNYLYSRCANGSPGAAKDIVPNMILVEKMKALEDYRMFSYFDIEGYMGVRYESVFPRESFSSFYGTPFGLASDSDVASFSGYVSSISNKMLTINASLPIIPAARIILTEAEAAYRGWISADAKQLYENGIRASFDWWDAFGVANYINSPRIAYAGGNDGFKQIVLQRWIASYLSDGAEAWSDWRRTDVPEMPVGPAAIDRGIDQYPYRLGFCSNSSSPYTKVSFSDAVNDLRGYGDTPSGRVWWDVMENTKTTLTPEQCTPPVIL